MYCGGGLVKPSNAHNCEREVGTYLENVLKFDEVEHHNGFAKSHVRHFFFVCVSARRDI